MISDRHLIVVAPHPDDETIGVGGIMHDHLQLGRTCEIVAVTDGEAADELADQVARSALAETRTCEREAALHALGGAAIAVARLGFPDRSVALHEREVHRCLCDIFAAAKNRFGSCLVVGTWREDQHPDHRAAGRATVAAARANGLRSVEVPIWAWYRRHIERMRPLARLRSVEISDAGREAKRRALACFSSQTEPLPGREIAVLPEDFLRAFVGTHEVLIA